MLTLERPVVFLDVETTGLHPQVDRVVQVGLVKVHPDGREVEWQTLVNPGIPIPPEVTATHHITDEMVASAPTFRELAPKLAGGLMGCDVGGFNVWFDLRMLREEFARVGGRSVLNGVRVVDAARIYHFNFVRNLSNAAKEYLGMADEELEGKVHDALFDARLSLRVFRAQLERHTELPRDVPALHAMFFEKPPQGYLDVDKKLAWRHGEATLNFGKHATVPLRSAPRDYLKWVVDKSDCSDVVKHVVREALAGRYPRRD